MSWTRPCFLSVQVRKASNTGYKGPGFLDSVGSLGESTAAGHRHLRENPPSFNGHLPVINGRDIRFPVYKPSAAQFQKHSDFTFSVTMGAPKEDARASEDLLKKFEVPQAAEIAARLFEDAHKHAYLARRRLALERLAETHAEQAQPKPADAQAKQEQAETCKDDEWEEKRPEEFQSLPKEEQKYRLRLEAFKQMGFGALLVLLFADPSVDILSKIGLSRATGPQGCPEQLAQFER